MPENYITSRTEKGNISISQDVLEVVVNAAVSEVEGVSGLSSAPGADIAEFLGIKSTTAPSVKITSENDKAVVDILIMVRYGYGVNVVAKKVQDRVATSIEDMAGLKTIVNVHITGIAFDKADIKG